MRKPVILITGASGELGHGLIGYFADHAELPIVSLDLEPVDPSIEAICEQSITGDILDDGVHQSLVSRYEIHQIYHLAALLSTSAEYAPERAHAVNVEGTLKLLRLAHDQARWHGHTVRFLFPSSIAAYGLPDRATKDCCPPLRETDHNAPTTIYGCNKLYCELLGRYYTLHYQQLAATPPERGVDFRSLRFPGLLSAVTMPSGGTSDYAPEMIHAAARGEPYSCFVDEGARLPFMTMPDAIRALTRLAKAPAGDLGRCVYNVTSFSLTAGELRDRVRSQCPGAEISFDPVPSRANIVDSWPGDVDDSPARQDWGWKPLHDFDAAFDDYLFPTLKRFYA